MNVPCICMHVHLCGYTCGCKCENPMSMSLIFLTLSQDFKLKLELEDLASLARQLAPQILSSIPNTGITGAQLKMPHSLVGKSRCN